MEVEIKNNEVIDVELSVKRKNGKDINLDTLSCQNLLEVLQEATNEFMNIQLTIETILDNKNPTGECYYNGEKKHWSEHISEISHSI